MSDTRRDIELRIRAQDLTSADLNRVTQAVAGLTAGLEKQIVAAKAGAISASELKAQLTQLEQAGKALTSISAIVDRFKDLQGVVKANEVNVNKARESLVQYRATLETTTNAGKAEERQLESRVKLLTASEATLERNKAALETMGAALGKAGIDTNNLTAAQTQLRTVADQVGVGLTKLGEANLNYARNAREAKQAATELATAQKATATALAEGVAARQAAQQAAERTTAAQAAAQQKLNQDSLAAAQAGIKRAQDARQKAADEDAAKERQNQARLVRIAIDANQAKADMIKKANDEEALRQKQLSDAKVAIIQAEQERIRRLLDAARNPQVGPPPGAQPGGRPPTRPGQQATQAFSFGGLTGYQLQNLSYQINDVVTQLASGTRASQVFAQQGGQILQLWTPNLFALRAYIGPIVVGITALTVAVGGLNSAFQQIGALRTFNAQLRANADGINYTGEALVQIARDASKFGVDFSTAMALIQQGVAGGITQSRLLDIIKLTKQFNDIRPDVSQKDFFGDLIDVFNKGGEALVAFQQKYGLLDDAIFKNARTLQDAGKIQEANRLILDHLTTKIGSIPNTLSPAEEAFRKLGIAWRDLTTTIGESPVFQGLITNLTTVIRLTGEFIDKLDKLKAADFSLKNLNLQSVINSAADAFLGNDFGEAGEKLKKYIKDSLPASAVTAAIPPAGSTEGVRIASNVKGADKPEIQALISMLSEARSVLKEGQAFEVFSGERPGATVKGTDRPSLHSWAGAVDVRIVDANNKPVETGVVGIMGKGLPGPEVDAAMRAASEKAGRPISIGTRFGDPGHYGIGDNSEVRSQRGRSDPVERAQAVTEEGVKQKALGDQIAIQDKRKILDADTYYSAQNGALRQAVIEQANRDAKESDEDTRRKHVQTETALFDSEQLKIKLQQSAEDTKRLAQDREHSAEVQAGGLAAQKNYLDQIKAAGGQVKIEEARKALLDGEETVRAKFREQDQARNDGNALQNAAAQLARQHELQSVTDITARLKAVDDQYRSIFTKLEEFQRKNPTAKNLPNGQSIDEFKSQIDTQIVAAKQDEEAKARLDGINQALQQRNTLISAYKSLLEKGIITQTEFDDKEKKAYDDASPKIKTLTQDFSAFLSEADKLDPSKVELYAAKLKDVQAQAQYISPLMKSINDAISTGLTSGLSQGFNTAAEAIGGLVAGTQKWKDVLKATETAIGQVFSTLFKDIAEAILKYEGLRLASALGLTGGDKGGGIGDFFSNLFGGSKDKKSSDTSTSKADTGDAASSSNDSGGGIFGSIFGFASKIFGNIFQTGGVVGSTSVGSRSMPASWFVNAPRYRTGGMVGLGSDEQAAILHRGEEVLSADNPRNMMNMASGGGSSAPVNIRSVLVLDEGLIPSAMSGLNGERIVMAHIAKNAATVRQLVKG